MISEVKPICLTGFGERVFGLQYRQGNRVYDSSQIAVCLTSSPVGGMGGYHAGNEPKVIVKDKSYVENDKIGMRLQQS